MGAHRREAFQAAFELTRQAGLIPLHQGQGGRFFGEPAEGEGEPDGVTHGFVLLGELIGLLVHLIFEEVGFYVPGALLAPAGDGHLFDQHALGVSGGCVLGDELFVQLGEGLAIFDRQADGVREGSRGGESVTGGVRGGAGFSFGRDRPSGLFPVGTGGAALAAGGHGLLLWAGVGSHCGQECTPAEQGFRC